MSPPISRRTLLAAGPLALGACARADDGYFGRTDPPRTQRVVYLLEFEPTTFDPAQSAERMEDLLLSLFEGLTCLHPATGTAMAGLATHYQVTPNGLRYRFYLRGHSEPGGIRLPDSSDLRGEFSRSRQAPSGTVQARWSDGVPLTAADFVYSWRRVLDPVTAAPDAQLMYCLAKAKEVNAGRFPAEQLRVRALDDFTLEAELDAPTPYFLELVSGIVFCPVPRHVIQLTGVRWTDPDRMVSNGPFVLREHRPYDRIVLARNEQYYEADHVALRELIFMVVTDGNARVNLYRSDSAAVTFASVPTVIPALRRKRDFQAKPSYATSFFLINTTTPPLDDVHVRYALNMATDKRPLADFNQAGSIPAVGLVPATDGYQPVRSLPISIDGVEYDVLSFNPRAARQLLSKIGKTLPARMECLGGNFPDTKLIQQVLQRQWRDNLSDPQYDDMLSKANSTLDQVSRMERLAECERRLLRAMPFVPEYHDVCAYPQKPYVRGIGPNVMDVHPLKYAWIDTAWKQEVA